MNAATAVADLAPVRRARDALSALEALLDRDFLTDAGLGRARQGAGRTLGDLIRDYLAGD